MSYLFTAAQSVPLILAKKHSSKNASAAVCYQDALSCSERGLNANAYQRALASLAHSVGIFHNDYKLAARHAKGAR